MKQAGAEPGRQIHWELGNQVPTKCISSSKFFGRIHALLRIHKFNRWMGDAIWWQGLLRVMPFGDKVCLTFVFAPQLSPCLYPIRLTLPLVLMDNDNDKKKSFILANQNLKETSLDKIKISNKPWLSCAKLSTAWAICWLVFSLCWDCLLHQTVLI